MAFGVVMIGQGFVKNYSGLIATRFFLGLAEAGIFPGSFYLISFWYKREEAQKRFSVYWSSVILAGAFGGLLATGISYMEGIRGLRSWQWIFILEGIVTVLIGIIAFFAVSDFPREAKWMSPEEKAFVLAKTGTDESHAVSVTFKDVLRYFTDIKVYFGALMYFSKCNNRLGQLLQLELILEISHCHSGLCLFVLCPDHYPDLGILDGTDPTSLSPALRCFFGVVSDHCLLFG